MTPLPPELSRWIDIRHIDSSPQDIIASEAECAALARRFALVSVDSLDARLTLAAEDGVITARGRLKAAIVQSCAVSGEDLPVRIDEPLTLRFVPEGRQDAADDEMEITAEDCDEIAYAGDRFDLGEAVAQSLALAIDPFAVGPNAEHVRQSGLLGEDASGPFAALAALKRKD